MLVHGIHSENCDIISFTAEKVPMSTRLNCTVHALSEDPSFLRSCVFSDNVQSPCIAFGLTQDTILAAQACKAPCDKGGNVFKPTHIQHLAYVPTKG